MNVLSPLPQPALGWLWIRLVRASFRSVFRRSFSVSGLYIVLLAVVVATVFSLDHEKTPQYLHTLFFLFGPITLALLILLGVRNGLSQTPFQFTPAETYFLMSAPFSQRQLVSYKIFQYHVMAIASSLIAALLVSRSWESGLLSTSKIYLILIFLQALPVASAVITGCRETLFSRTARFLVDTLLFMMIVALIAAIYFAFVGQNALSRSFGKLLYELTRPLFFSSALLPGASVGAMKGALLTIVYVDIVLLVMIQLGHSRLSIESVIYKNLADNRRKIARLRGTPLGAVKFGALFPLSWFTWGKGLGPLLWRKVQEYLRNFWNVLLIAGMVGLAYSGFAIFMIRVYPPVEDFGMKLWQVFVAAKIFVLYTALFSGFCDFRSDTSQITVFRTWPISAGKMVTAQVMISALNLLVMTTLMIGIGAALYGSYTPYEVTAFTLASICTVPFLTFFVAALNNIIVLLLPVSESFLSGRTIGKILVQFAGLWSVAALLSVGLYKVEGWAAGLAKAHGDSHWWFMIPLIVSYFVVGWMLFFVLCQQFNRFDVSKK